MIEELAFYKKECARLQGEMNAMKHKMMQNERTVKAAVKDKSDAHIGTQVLEKTLKEVRSEAARAGNQVAQFKSSLSK